MTPADIEAYLYERIPLSAAMQLRVTEACDDRVVIDAPLAPNLNHRSTAFGGSVSALAIVAGWTQVHFRLHREGFSAETVIQESAVRYVTPIDGPFRATVVAPDDEAWNRFTRTLRRRSRGRIRLQATVEHQGVVAATFRGAYVAFLPEES